MPHTCNVAKMVLRLQRLLLKQSGLTSGQLP
nr:MAG TPA_asm: hypothetical protein [Caudoviricetes sp.]